MSGVIIPETMQIDPLPGVWAPVQWRQTEDERAVEVEAQARASLLANVDIPETILRLLLDEGEVELVYEPPAGYDPEQQGEWDANTLTFAFKRPIRLVEVTRNADKVEAVYDFGTRGMWSFEIEPERFSLEKV